MIPNEIINDEIIKPIKGFPNYYITDSGKCYTTYPSKRYGNGFRELKSRLHPTGYVYLGLYKTNDDGVVQRKWLRVHRVVWEHFGGKLNRGMVIDHIDENKSNNNITNLQSITQSANVIKSIQYKRNKVNENN